MRYLLTIAKAEGGYSQRHWTEVVGIYDTLGAIKIYLKDKALSKYKVYEVTEKKLEITID